MNWEQVKGAKEVQLDGVTVEFDRRDSKIAEVIVRDAKGGMLRVTNDSWTLGVFQPAKPKVQKRFVVVGTVRGLKVDEPFEHEHEATARRNELNDLAHLDEAVKVEPREVEVSE